MEGLKPKGAKLNLFDREWQLVFTVGVIEDIQEHFDIHIDKFVTKLDKKDRDFYANLTHMILMLINEQVELENEKLTDKVPLYDYKTVKRHITNLNSNHCLVAILSAYTLSWMKASEDQVQDPNV